MRKDIAMSMIDKIGIGMGIFFGVFMVFFLGVSRNAFELYYSDVARRKLGRVVRLLVTVVFALAFPYFYDVLVGFDNEGLSTLLELGIGFCAVLVLADVAWFLYKNYGPPTDPRRRRRA